MATVQVTTAKDLEKEIPYGAPVEVQLNDHWGIKEPMRNQKIYGYFLGVFPNEKIHAALRDPKEGLHWLVQIGSPASDDLIDDVHLALIREISVVPEQVVRK